ncbi:DUF3307 domain-containing protein [Peptococcaceae bacterium 1198_IL3148]
MENVLWVLLAHYVADYPLQGDFLAQTKGKYWYSLLAHSMIYALCVSLCFELLGVFATWKFYVLFVSHVFIDYRKATAKNKEKALTTYLYIDQSLHITINFLLYVA